MTKKKILQFGVLVIVLAGLITGGVLLRTRLAIRADIANGEILPPPTNLQAVLPSAADDVAQNHWAQKYIDAVTKPSFGVGKNEMLIPFMGSSHDFQSESLVTADQLAGFIVRLKYFTPTGCTGFIYNDVDSNKTWACAYIEKAYNMGYFNGTALYPSAANGRNYNPTQNFSVQILKSVMAKAGLTTNNPPGYTCNDSCLVTRAMMAGFLAYNANLPGDNAYPSVALKFNFPVDPSAGFDFGYRLWRQDLLAPLYVQDPPGEGMEEGSDLGLAYDKTVQPGKQYTYAVEIFNRDGDESGPANGSASIAQGLFGSHFANIIKHAYAFSNPANVVTITIP